MANFLEDLGQIGTELVGIGARTIGTALGGPLAGAAAGMLADKIGSALGIEPPKTTPAIKEAWDQLAPAQKTSVAQSADIDWTAVLVEESKTAGLAVQEINQTARTEVRSEDAYVRRGRPTIAYAFAYLAVLFGTVIACIAVIIAIRFDAGGIATAFAALATFLGALGVFLGVVMVPVTGWVNSRGRQKEAQLTGERSPGLIENIAKAFGKAR